MPAFRVGKPRLQVRRSADIVLAAGLNVVPFDVVVFEDVALWNAGTFEFTADRPGLYQTHCNAFRNAVAAGTAVTLLLDRNGVEYTRNQSLATTATVGCELNSLIELEVADTVRWRVQLSASAAATFRTLYSQGSIVHLGPKRWT